MVTTSQPRYGWIVWVFEPPQCIHDWQVRSIVDQCSWLWLLVLLVIQNVGFISNLVEYFSENKDFVGLGKIRVHICWWVCQIWCCQLCQRACPCFLQWVGIVCLAPCVSHRMLLCLIPNLVEHFSEDNDCVALGKIRVHICWWVCPADFYSNVVLSILPAGMSLRLAVGWHRVGPHRVCPIVCCFVDFAGCQPLWTLQVLAFAGWARVAASALRTQYCTCWKWGTFGEIKFKNRCWTNVDLIV